MKTFIVTGSQTGMGLAAYKLLEKNGCRVIGISNTDDAEITADLSTDEGVAYAVAEAIKVSNGKIDGVFANAGIDNQDWEKVFGLNYFGIIQMLGLLHPYLKASDNARVVINASNSVMITPGIPDDAVNALVAEDKEKAFGLIARNPRFTYQVSKVAITKWVRLNAPLPRWAGNNISMNCIAPGVVMTPLIEHDMKDPRKAAGIQMLPKPLGAVPNPEDIAPLVKFLLLDNSKFIIGQSIVIDGGTEATWRGAERPDTWDISPEDFKNKITL